MRHGLVEQRDRSVPLRGAMSGKRPRRNTNNSFLKRTKRRRAGKKHPHTSVWWCRSTAIRRPSPVVCEMLQRPPATTRFLFNRSWTADDASLQLNDLDCFFLHCVSPLCFEGRLAPYLVKAKNQGEFCGHQLKIRHGLAEQRGRAVRFGRHVRKTFIGRGGTQIIHSFKKTKLSEEPGRIVRAIS